MQVDNTGNDTGGALAVAPTGGKLYVTWWDAKNMVIAVASSTDGGVTYGRLGNVAMTTLSGKYQPPNYPNPIAVNTSLAFDTSSGGPSSNTGNLYLVWNDKDTDGKLHIFFARSRDGGGTWKPSRARIDTGNNNDAWQPTVSVDQSSGLLTIAWYDRRNDSSDHFYRGYYTQSADGGTTFLSQQLPVSSCSADPTVDSNGTGDYMGMTSVYGIAHPGTG